MSDAVLEAHLFQQAPGAVLRGNVETLNGPLQASGFAELAGRRYAVDIVMGSDAVLDPQLQQMLSLIAVPEGVGYRVIVDGDF